MRHVKRDYANAEITVHWDSSKCIHCGICVRGLPSVFDINRRPWIEIDGAAAPQIASQVEACPSGALSYTLADES